MRSLLDINVVIALLDPDHIFQERAHKWWSANGDRGWASCPLTENGVVRIMTSPGYSQKIRFTAAEVVLKVTEFIDKTDHQFWPDAISMLDNSRFDYGRIHGPRQLTDLYLLALATKHNGRLLTFDQGISLSTVKGAKAENLYVA